MTKKNTGNYHQIAGVLYHIGNAENKSRQPDKSFYVKEFILEIKTSRGGRFYSAFAKFEIKGEDKMYMTDPYEVGDPVVVTFTLDGRKWKPPDEEEEIIFNSLRAIGVEHMPEESKEEETDVGDLFNPPDLLPDNKVEDDVTDMPF